MILFGVATYFLFLFFNEENLSKNKNPSMTQVSKNGMRKLDSGFGDLVTYQEGTSREVAPL